MKVLKTILLSITFLSAITLWLTRDQYMPSLSSFALSDNAMWYRMMHVSVVMFFTINAVEFKKYATEFALAGGMACILIFDMYRTPDLHTIITVGTLLLACVTLFVNSKISKVVAGFLTLSAAGIFAFGYFTEFHFLLAEVLAMACISAGKLIEIHQD